LKPSAPETQLIISKMSETMCDLPLMTPAKTTERFQSKYHSVIG
jgi:hypothetical protein